MMRMHREELPGWARTLLLGCWVGALRSMALMEVGETVARWKKGERTVEYMVGQGRLESFEAEDLSTLADAAIGRTADLLGRDT